MANTGSSTAIVVQVGLPFAFLLLAKVFDCIPKANHRGLTPYLAMDPWLRPITKVQVPKCQGPGTKFIILTNLIKIPNQHVLTF